MYISNSPNILKFNSYFVDDSSFGAVVIVESEKNKTSKKRLPSASPDGKMWLSTSGSESGGEAMEEVNLKCMNGWQNCHSRKCAGAIANRMPMGPGM